MARNLGLDKARVDDGRNELALLSRLGEFLGKLPANEQLDHFGGKVSSAAGRVSEDEVVTQLGNLSNPIFLCSRSAP